MFAPLETWREPGRAGKRMNSRSESKNQDASPLGLAPCGFCGCVKKIDGGTSVDNLTATELERRLLEIGFLEGAAVEVLHEGPLCRDPIAVRLNGTTVALRRREAMAVLVA
jgi:ferrous iron transport protein A